MGDGKVTPETEVSTTELACILGITGRRIRQMAEDGQLDKVEQGRFRLCDAVQRYIGFISKDKTISQQDKERADAEISIKKAKAIMSVLEAREMQGKMHRSEDVAGMTEDLVFTIRGMLLALPGRLAVDVATAKSAPEAAEIIRDEVHKVMQELSSYHYDPKKYEERVRERRSWDNDSWDADD